MSKKGLHLLILIAATGLLVAGQVSAYDFPFEDPLLATVVGTPSQYRADLPEDPPRKVLELTMTGYSLGGFNAAFIAKLDEERHIFNSTPKRKPSRGLSVWRYRFPLL